MGYTKYLVNLYDKLIKVECINIFSTKYRIYSNIPRATLSIIIYDEEVYIKKFILPKASKESLNHLVKNELNYSLGMISNLLFDYILIGEKNKMQEVLVYYINSERRENIKNIINSYRLRKIKIFQFLVYSAYKKSIKEKNTIFIFYYADKIYFIRILNNNIVDNKLVNENEKNKVFKTISGFLNKFNEEKVAINSIYSLNEDLLNLINIAEYQYIKRNYIGELDILKIKRQL